MSRASARGLFVTGTDTGIGKTFVSVGLLHGLRRQGLRVAGMKPVASGCEQAADGSLVNADALALQAACSGQWQYSQINPYALADPVAPQFAAERQQVEIGLPRIRDCYRQLLDSSDRVVVEGVGGWRVPLSAELDTIGLVAALELPVLLVVGMRLGCISHALLTAEALAADGVQCHGWVANHLQPDYDTAGETVAVLNARLGLPLLAEIAPAAEIEDPCWDRLAARLNSEQGLS